MGSDFQDWMVAGARVARIELSPELLTIDGVETPVTIDTPLPEDIQIKRVASDRATGKTVVYVTSAAFEPRAQNAQAAVFDPGVSVDLESGMEWPFLTQVREWVDHDPNHND